MKIKTVKTYIETNLANGFICLSKFPAKAPNLFIQIPNNSFRLYINYQNLSNLIIKNKYSLFLIYKFLN